MNFKELQVDRDGSVLCIRFNRARAFNAMNFALLAELAQAIDLAAADSGLRVVVLTGNGRAFSAGADLTATMAQPPLDADGRIDLGYALAHYYNPIVRRMQALPQPVIAAVNGVAAGGAASLALGADLTVAARSASFVQAFIHVGLVPDAGGSWFLPRLVGRQRAMGMSLLGQTVSAERALELGMIWDVVDDDDLLPASMRLAQKLASGPRTGIAAMKRALHAAADNTLDQQLDLEEHLQRECGLCPDFAEGANAFIEKRRPVFAA
ncbi:enoyl-CoA hydratase-related protein [Solimonas terrae]|uniref:2-(1,2-epoxy-1,2-dihydrophenyl)acetyl-CoA isomerase n=1 Tax=Solimonas terrae TaxID=1396819 RepID=A0A6M2BY10_9GAMM|nr:enoyl-CoA hydratase-related protein [Solimonas terrae]NGY07051.1 2-(1,2-epoxy-1,2-dihydrophenyl)acetyl-CoA isomerase [Solimonas terrae]